jgi:hypothetical protein
LLFVFFAANARAQQRNSPKPDNRSRAASISGRITIGGKPAANAKVIVTEFKDPYDLGYSGFRSSGSGSGIGESYDVLTDGDGRYRAPNLPEGKYQVQVMLGNCVRETPSLKESQGGPLVELFSLDDGEARADVDFALVRGGVITGRVLDPDGRPLIARVVTLQVIDEKGQAQGYRNHLNWETLQTDDRGVYRLYALRAGRYVISAGGPNDGGLAAGGAGKYPRTWSPDATDVNKAKVIDVTEGGEVTDVDIRFGVARKTYEAVGRVVEDETGKPVMGASLFCIQTRGENGASGQFGGTAKSDDQGNFRFGGLGPGRYQIAISDNENLYMGKGNDYYSDGAKFEIQSDDISNIEIRTKRGATISGVAVVEEADPSAKSSLSQTMITAFVAPMSWPAPGNNGDDTIFTPQTSVVFSRISSDGNFLIKGLRSGKVTLNVQEAARRVLQIVRIERDGADVGDGIVVNDQENVRGVRLILGKGSGVIRGQVLIKGAAWPEGARMTVYANSAKAGGGFGGQAEVDNKGRFVIEGLLPGEYILLLMGIPAPTRPNSQPPLPPPPPIKQAVTVIKGQEAQVTITVERGEKSSEEK